MREEALKEQGETARQASAAVRPPPALYLRYLASWYWHDFMVYIPDIRDLYAKRTSYLAYFSPKREDSRVLTVMPARAAGGGG